MAPERLTWTCPECGKPFKPMTDRQRTVNYYIHRISASGHKPLRTREYMETVKEDYLRQHADLKHFEVKL